MAAVPKLLTGMLCGAGAIAAIIGGVLASATGREMVSTAIFYGSHVAIIGPFAFLAGAFVVGIFLVVVGFFVGASAFAILDSRMPGRPTVLEGFAVPLAAVVTAWALWHQLHGWLQATWGVGAVAAMYVSLVAGAAIVALADALGRRIQPLLVDRDAGTASRPVPLAAVGVVALVALLSTLQPAPEAARSDAELAMKCREAGAVFYAEPARTVTSIAHDWDPVWRDEPPTWQTYSFDADGRWTSSRQGPWGRPMLRDNPSADVVVIHEVFGYDPKRAPAKQGLLRYVVTVKDRRDDQVLAVLTYVLDSSGRRGCGTNRANAIDIADFVRRATTPGGGDKPIYWKPM